jgi:hypothetical protein
MKRTAEVGPIRRMKSGRSSRTSGTRAAVAIEPKSLVDHSAESGIRFSICTLVTRPEQYRKMIGTFEARGFAGNDCEYLFLDNSSSNAFDAYEGLNLFLNNARGEYIIVCHQDVELLSDGRDRLDAVMAELEAKDPLWAVIGNSGGVSPGRLAIRITDPHGADEKTDLSPVRVRSLDENFLVVRRRANLALSHDLGGFHLYGTDICIIADILGWRSYVVDFHLHHLSPGYREQSLSQSRVAMIRKYARALRARWVMSPCELLFLSGGPWWLSVALSSKFARRVLWGVERLAPGVMARLSGVPSRDPPAMH